MSPLMAQLRRPARVIEIPLMLAKRKCRGWRPRAGFGSSAAVGDRPPSVSSSPRTGLVGADRLFRGVPGTEVDRHTLLRLHTIGARASLNAPSRCCSGLKESQPGAAPCVFM